MDGPFGGGGNPQCVRLYTVRGLGGVGRVPPYLAGVTPTHLLLSGPGDKSRVLKVDMSNLRIIHEQPYDSHDFMVDFWPLRVKDRRHSGALGASKGDPRLPQDALLVTKWRPKVDQQATKVGQKATKVDQKSTKRESL